MDDVLEWEFQYAASTAEQAQNDRAAVVNIFFLLVGGVGSIGGLVFAALAEKMSLDKDDWVNKNKADQLMDSFTQNVVPMLLLFVAVTGCFAFFKLARLRQAWRDSLRTMNKIKEFAITKSPDLRAAFSWTTETMPAAGIPWSITWNLALIVSMIDSLAIAAAAYLAPFFPLLLEATAFVCVFAAVLYADDRATFPTKGALDPRFSLMTNATVWVFLSCAISFAVAPLALTSLLGGKPLFTTVAAVAATLTLSAPSFQPLCVDDKHIASSFSGAVLRDSAAVRKHVETAKAAPRVRQSAAAAAALSAVLVNVVVSLDVRLRQTTQQATQATPAQQTLQVPHQATFVDVDVRLRQTIQATIVGLAFFFAQWAVFFFQLRAPGDPPVLTLDKVAPTSERSAPEFAPTPTARAKTPRRRAP
jgi:hypothetical protein